MRYGLGITLLVIGAVAAFAVQKRISGIDLTMIGYIFMGAGALALLFEIITASSRRERSVTRERTVDGAGGTGVVERERTIETDDRDPRV